MLNLYKYFLDGFIFPFITDLPFFIFNFEKLMWQSVICSWFLSSIHFETVLIWDSVSNPNIWCKINLRNNIDYHSPVLYHNCIISHFNQQVLLKRFSIEYGKKSGDYFRFGFATIWDCRLSNLIVTGLAWV